MKKSQISVRKTIFFPGELFKNFVLLYTFITLVIIHTKCGSLWTTAWPEKNSIFLKIEISKKPIFLIEIRTFFYESWADRSFWSQSLPTLGILHAKFGLIWTTSWPDKKDLFFKLLIRKNRKFPYEKLIFFLCKLYKKFFLLYTFITLVIIHTKCGSLWTTAWPEKNSIFLKIEKSKKSIFPIEIRTFFLWKLGGPFFLSQSLPTPRILHTKFGLIWATSWPDKKDLFLKLLIWKNCKFPHEKLIFFQGKLYKKFFLLHSFITLVIIHNKCGSLWTTPWPDKKTIFLKTGESKKSIFPIEIRTLFRWKLGGPFFLSQSLPTLWILHTRLGLIWTTSWPDKNACF